MRRLTVPLLAAAALLGAAGCTTAERVVYDDRDDYGYDRPVYRSGGYFPRGGGGGWPGGSWGQGRPRDAIELCRAYAEDLVRARGAGHAVEVAQVTRAEEDDDKVEVEGYVRVAERDGDRHRARIDCEVDFKDRNEIVAFSHDGLFRQDEGRDRGYVGGGGGNWQPRPRRDDDRWQAARRDDRPRQQRQVARRDDGDRGGGGRGLGQEAGQACRKVARGQGYDVASVGDRDRTGNGQRVDMRLRRGDRRFDATCAYNANRGEARLVRLEPRRG
jgi:hypothetical protein